MHPEAVPQPLALRVSLSEQLHGPGPVAELRTCSKPSPAVRRCRLGGVGKETDLLPSTYQPGPVRMKVDLLLVTIVNIVSTVTPPLRSLVRSSQ